MLKTITNDYYNLKRLLAKDKIKIVKWEKFDDHFSDLIVATAGGNEVFRYAKQALKTQVEQLLISYMNK